MSAWAASFLAVSFLVVPAAVKMYGGPLSDLTAQDKALITLATQTAVTVASLGIIRAVTSSALEQ
jgi:hypothetical protein